MADTKGYPEDLAQDPGCPQPIINVEKFQHVEEDMEYSTALKDRDSGKNDDSDKEGNKKIPGNGLYTPKKPVHENKVDPQLYGPKTFDEDGNEIRVLMIKIKIKNK